MEGSIPNRPSSFVDEASAALAEARKLDARDPAALTHAAIAAATATLASASATLEVAEELRRSREGALTAAEKVALAPKLTLREQDILKLLGGGATNREMADRLGLSTHTVKDHTSALYRKLGARNRAQAVAVAREFGLA